jgi:hypothetical protein
MSKSFEIIDYARYRKYVTNSVLEELHTGMRWSEGPVWFADTQTCCSLTFPQTKSTAGWKVRVSLSCVSRPIMQTE